MKTFREQLKDDSKDLRKEFGAKQVAVDGCNEISLKTEWIWVSVGLGKTLNPNSKYSTFIP